MNKLIEFNVAGGTVVVESQEATTGGVVRGAALAHMAEKAGKSLGDSLAVIRPLAEAALAMCDGLVPVPENAELEFGVKFDIELGAVIAKSSVEGNLRVKLLWKPK